ncbi:MAG: transporter substrate-binding domain-containing protein [Bacteroidaceae bacterium]|nr:transporter substrate-binding domain-containing protein [Bacteroidaceae bacterium]
MPYRKYLIIGVIIAIVSALMLPGKEEKSPMRDYADIAEEGVLRVTLSYGANSYHVNEDGEFDGFYYQLIKQFAEEHGWRLEVIPEMNATVQNNLLQAGTCDLIADGRLVTGEADSISMKYTLPVNVDRLILVQRKANTDSLCTHLQSQIELAGKTVCVPEHSLFKQRIQHIMEEIGDSIHILEIPRYEQEQLMALVAHGDICYTVCEEDVVHTHLNQYPQLDTSLPISFNQFYSWTVRTHSPALLDSINAWINRNL